ncbi:MAG: hypothetical protein ACLFN5_03000, partial [bacterium]
RLYSESGEAGSPWDSVRKFSEGKGFAGVPDLKKLILVLGVDLIKQFGRRPYSASKTLHGSLLRLRSRDKLNSAQEKLIALLLGYALANLKSRRQFHLILPFYESGSSQLLRLFVHLGDTPEGWLEADWWLAGLLKMTAIGELRFNIQRRQDRINLTFFSEGNNLLEKIRSREVELKKNIERCGYRLNVDYKNKKPSPLPDPFEPADEPKQPRVPGKVDFQA